MNIAEKIKQLLNSENDWDVITGIKQMIQSFEIETTNELKEKYLEITQREVLEFGNYFDFPKFCKTGYMFTPIKREELKIKK